MADNQYQVWNEGNQCWVRMECGCILENAKNKFPGIPEKRTFRQKVEEKRKNESEISTQSGELEPEQPPAPPDMAESESPGKEEQTEAASLDKEESNRSGWSFFEF